MHTVSIHLTVIVHVSSHNYMLQCLGGLGLKRLHLVQLFFFLLLLSLLNLDVALSVSTSSFYFFLLEKKNLPLLSEILLVSPCEAWQCTSAVRDWGE